MSHQKSIILRQFILNLNFIFSLPTTEADAIAEASDDPEVIRAKYFIRDEFLVSRCNFSTVNFVLENQIPQGPYHKLNMNFYFNFFSVSRLQVAMENITVIRTLLARLIPKISNEYLMTVVI